MIKPETIEEAKAVLKLSGYIFNRDGDEPGNVDEFLIILNDTWGWACADCEPIPEENLIEVAELFRRYGYCGLLYWAGKKQGVTRSEFEDINRFMDFVKNEEAIMAEVPDSNRRAYAKREYTLGKGKEKT